MTTQEAIRQLREMGGFIQLTEDGRIITRIKPTPEACALLETIRADREGAKECLRQYGMFDAVAIAQAVKRGEAKLTGKVIYHRQENLATVPWEAVSGNLRQYRERLRTALEQRLREIEACNIDGLSSETVERLAEEYGQCWRLLHGDSPMMDVLDGNVDW